MIFSSENARSFKKFRLNLYTTFIRFVVPENPALLNDKKYEFLSVMKRGKSPRFRNEGAGSHRKEES